MKVIFTSSKLPFSWLIKWTFNQPVSHVAFVFDDKWLIHSNFLGVNFQWFSAWKKSNNVVFELSYDLSLLQQEALFQSILDSHAEDPYEWAGFLYFCWRGLLYKLFRMSLPKSNPLNGKGMLCTELLVSLPPWITNLPEDIDLSIITPYNLYEILSEAKQKKALS